MSVESGEYRLLVALDTRDGETFLSADVASGDCIGSMASNDWILALNMSSMKELNIKLVSLSNWSRKILLAGRLTTRWSLLLDNFPPPPICDSA